MCVNIIHYLIKKADKNVIKINFFSKLLREMSHYIKVLLFLLNDHPGISVTDLTIYNFSIDLIDY